MLTENLTFKKASHTHHEIILKWLSESHVMDFWDNSPQHKEDILIFMNGRKEPSPYFNGIFDYWIGLIEDEPYCLIMTSEILPDEEDLPEIWKNHLSVAGKTFGLDFMIGNKKYLSKGLGGPTLEKFTSFMQNTIDHRIDTFFIDPAASNPRAKRVYEKGGFKTVDVFYRDSYKHYLMVKKMPNC